MEILENFQGLFITALVVELESLGKASVRQGRRALKKDRCRSSRNENSKGDRPSGEKIFHAGPQDFFCFKRASSASISGFFASREAKALSRSLPFCLSAYSFVASAWASMREILSAIRPISWPM